MFVLDAWAVMALFDDEPAAERVERAILEDEGLISWINLGEAYYVSIRRRGRDAADRAVGALRRRVRVEAPTPPLVLEAARLKACGRLSYADAFCVATARRHGAPLWTGDAEIVAAARDLDVVDLREAP